MAAIAFTAATIGPACPPWNFTVFWLICRITGVATRSAPAMIASACSNVMTL